MTAPLKRLQPPGRGEYLSYLDIPRPTGQVDMQAVLDAMATCSPGSGRPMYTAQERRLMARMRRAIALGGGIRKWT